MFAFAWVAIAPAPALAQETTAAAAKNLDCTATPQSWRPGSKATMEKVAIVCIKYSSPALTNGTEKGAHLMASARSKHVI
jgi:hypothetical protein